MRPSAYASWRRCTAASRSSSLISDGRSSDGGVTVSLQRRADDEHAKIRQRLKAPGTEMTQISVISVRAATIDDMPRDADLIFADHVGRFYARQYGFPPMAGRLLGYLFVC